MRIHGSDDHIQELIEQGSSSWNGPSPSARQSRWAASERRRRAHGARLVAAVHSVAALALRSIALLATSRSPDNAAASVARLVSHELTCPTGAPPAMAPPQPIPAVSPSAEAGASPAPLRSTLRPSLSSAAWSELGGRARSPSPAPSASATPSPTSTRPDE